MKRSIMHILLALSLWVGALLPLPQHLKAQPREALLVIVSGATGLHDISSTLLRRVFEGYPSEYRSGKRLLPLNQPIGTAARTQFDQAVLGLTPDEVGRFWVDQRIRAAAQPPRTLPSAEIAVRVVASFPGAITYTSPALVGAGLNVLTVDGKGPSDEGYLFAR